MGSSLVLGTVAMKLPRRKVNLALAAFVFVGFAGRAGMYDPGAPTEYNLSTTSKALQKVEAGFKALEQTLPRGTPGPRLRSDTGTGGRSYPFVPIPGIARLVPGSDAHDHAAGLAPSRTAGERLFWVSPDANVFEIDLRTKGARSSGPEPNYVQYQKTLRYYARGLTATGDIFSGLHVLLRMPEPDYPSWVLDRHLAAMLLYATGRDQEASVVLTRVPNLSRTEALGVLSAVLATPSEALS